MFQDFRDMPAPPPWRPPERSPAKIHLTERQRRTVSIIIGINLVLLLVVPIGGATIVAAIVALCR